MSDTPADEGTAAATAPPLAQVFGEKRGETPPEPQQEEEKAPEVQDEPDGLPPHAAKVLENARRQERDALARARRAEAKLAEVDESARSKTEAAQSKATLAEQSATEARMEAQRLRVGIAKGLPVDLAERLRGETVDELVADADALLESLGQPAEGGAPPPSPRPVVRTGDTADLSPPSDPVRAEAEAVLAVVDRARSKRGQ